MVEKMQRLLGAFKEGRAGEKNPAKKINQIYQVGLEYRGRKRPKRKR